MNVIFFVLFAVPVFAAQYYSLERSPLALVTAMMSLCMLVFLVGKALASIRLGLARTTVGLIVTFFLACYFYGQFLSYYLQGSYFNQQFYYHFNISSLTESWSVYWPLMLLFLVWLTALWICLLYFSHRLSAERPTGASLAVLFILTLMLDPGLRQSAMAALAAESGGRVQSLAQVNWQRLKLNREVLESADVSAEPGKNLVLIYMEGLDVVYTEEEIFPALTPNLNRLNTEGWQLDNLIPIDGTRWTMGGIVSSLCGTPLVHDLGLDGNVIMFTGFLDRAICLPDILHIAGYEQTFMGGASLDFAGKGEFFNAHNFDRVLGRDQLVPRLPDPSYTGGWGLFDDSLFDLAFEEFKSLAASGGHFNLTVLTVDTHHPTGEPSASCDAYPFINNSILDAVHCTDQLVGKFIDKLKQHPAYENTIIILASDHLGMRNNASSLFPEDYDRKLYFNVLNASSSVPSGRIATPVDLAPTILGLLEIKHNAPFLAGGNLLKGELLSVSDIEIFADRQQAIGFINSNYLSSLDGEGRLLYSLRRTRLTDLAFSAHVKDANLSIEGLRFNSTGTDPYFILPKLNLASTSGLRLYVTLEAERDSTFTLYFPTGDSPYYSETNTIKANTTAGENRIRLSLDAVATDGQLRIDPGANPGTFLISRIEIRS